MSLYGIFHFSDFLFDELPALLQLVLGLRFPCGLNVSCGGGPVLTIASYLTEGSFLVPGSLSWTCTIDL